MRAAQQLGERDLAPAERLASQVGPVEFEQVPRSCTLAVEHEGRGAQPLGSLDDQREAVGPVVAAPGLDAPALRLWQPSIFPALPPTCAIRLAKALVRFGPLPARSSAATGSARAWADLSSVGLDLRRLPSRCPCGARWRSATGALATYRAYPEISSAGFVIRSPHSITSSARPFNQGATSAVFPSFGKRLITRPPPQP